MTKRKLEHEATEGGGDEGRKKHKGFQIGPANLPDGPERRKFQKIKHSLIDKAKIKKSYAKIKQQQQQQQQQHDDGEGEVQHTVAASLELHPERQAMLDSSMEGNVRQKEMTSGNYQYSEQQDEERPRHKRPRQTRREQLTAIAEQQRAEAEARRRAREEADRQRKEKVEERERFRRAMAKARAGGRNGQRKLGRESAILLEKARRLMDQTG